MSTSPGLEPINNCVLVQIGQQYKHAAVPEKKYDQRTNGILVAVSNDLDEDNQKRLAPWVGRTVYWESYNEDSQVTKDGVQFAFIRVKDLMGVDLNGR